MQNSVVQNKPLNVNNSHCIVDTHPEKITENITPDELDDSNNTEQNIAISEHPAQPKNSNNHLPFGVEKVYDFSEKLGKLYIKIEAVKMFIKEQFFIVKSSIENIDVRNENHRQVIILHNLANSVTFAFSLNM